MRDKPTFTAAGVLVAAIALAGDRAQPPTAADGRIGARAARLEPWQPVDPMFSGCSEGVCGRRGRNPQAVAQPGAKVGQTVYCPVSGAVFQVRESSRRVDLDGKRLYLCCEACARYFAAHRDSVVALRGFRSHSSGRSQEGSK